MNCENVVKFALMEFRNRQSWLRLLNRSMKGWMNSGKERFNRVVAAFLAVALLVTSMPVAAYAQEPSEVPVPSPVQSSAPSQASDSKAPVANTPTSDDTQNQAQELKSAQPAPRRGGSVGRAVPHASGRPAPAALPDSIGLSEPVAVPAAVVEDEIDTRRGRVEVVPVDTIQIVPDSLGMTLGGTEANDSVAMLLMKSQEVVPDEWVAREVEFNPDPTKAVWMSALFPGLGQIYNRRYWKLPIIVGGYLGLAYATSWNNGMLRDYTRAYADLLDKDPNTRSYMDMFSPNVKEENIDRGWLQNVIKSRKNYFRRNRDLCIICMVGVYLLAMVDAYVDASLSHFDISPELSMDVAPAMMQDGRQRYPSVGLVWALNF